MKTVLHIIFLAIIFPLSVNAQMDIRTLDTIVIEKEHIIGRWIEEKKLDDDKNIIYIFKEDNTFYQAVDNGELLIFNVAGKYELVGNSVRIYFQDFSRAQKGKVKMRTTILEVIALSDNELNINKTEYSDTKYYAAQFARLKRQNKK